MIEIFLNPDNSEMFAESAEAKGNTAIPPPPPPPRQSSHPALPRRTLACFGTGDNTEHIQNALTLIKELRDIGDVTPKYYTSTNMRAYMQTYNQHKILCW